MGTDHHDITEILLKVALNTKHISGAGTAYPSRVHPVLMGFMLLDL
jgi:hypothetical protein